MHSGGMTELSPDIFELTNLEILDFTSNAITTVPEEISALTLLSSL